MATLTDPITPASNFEVRKFKGFRVHFSTPSGKVAGYIEMDGFGIWDLTFQGWVSFCKMQEIPGYGMLMIPYSLPKKKNVEFAIAQGLYTGKYAIIK